MTNQQPSHETGTYQNLSGQVPIYCPMACSVHSVQALVLSPGAVADVALRYGNKRKACWDTNLDDSTGFSS